MSRAAPLLQIKNLQRRFGDKIAVDDLSFQLDSAQVCALLGPNGAGKTTLIRMLTGLLRPDRGTILYHGQAYDAHRHALKQMIGVVPQHNNIDRELTAEENLRVHGLLYHQRGKQLQQAIDRSLELAGLESQRHQAAESLSGGMKRRLVIARALMHQPSILFLDEATVGLDPHSRRRIWGFLREIQQTGCTIFLTTHYLDEAEQLADRVMLFEHGRLIADAAPTSLKAKLGSHVVDQPLPEPRQWFYPNRQQAVAGASALEHAATIREVNLEDVFLTLTGRRLNAND